MPDYHVKITAANQDVKAAHIVKFLKKYWWSSNNLSLSQLLVVARIIKTEQGWYPEWYELKSNVHEQPIFSKMTDDSKNFGVLVEVTVTKSNHEILIEEFEYQMQLLDRACNGDVKAALEYCDREKKVLISMVQSDDQ